MSIIMIKHQLQIKNITDIVKIIKQISWRTTYDQRPTTDIILKSSSGNVTLKSFAG